MHDGILSKAKFRSETRPKRSQTNFHRLDSGRIDASGIPRSAVLALDRQRLRTRNLHKMVVKSGQSSSKNLNPSIEIDTEQWRNLFPDSSGAGDGVGQPGEDQLGGAKDDQADFGRYAEAYWSADGAESAVHVDVRHGRRRRGEERRAERQSGGGVRSGAFIGGGREERALVRTSDVVGDEARGAEAMVENFDLDLSAVGVASEGKFDAEFGGSIESIGIVREENVGHVAADQRLDESESLLALAARSAFALVIDADEIERGTLESNLRVFLAQQLHAGLGVEISRFVFRASVDFVVAVAAPGAKGRVKTANFVDAIGNGIAGAGDEIASDDGQVGAEIIGHIHSTAHLCAGHVAAEVNVADLHDLHAVESGRQIGQGNLDAADLVVEALSSEAIHGAEEWSSAGSGRGGAEKVAAARVGNRFGKFVSGRGSGRVLSGRILRCGSM